MTDLFLFPLSLKMKKFIFHHLRGIIKKMLILLGKTKVKILMQTLNLCLNLLLQYRINVFVPTYHVCGVVGHIRPNCSLLRQKPKHVTRSVSRNIKRSSTYKKVPCSSSQSQSLKGTSFLGSNDSSCSYSMSYGDQSFSNENLAVDTHSQINKKLPCDSPKNYNRVWT